MSQVTTNLAWNRGSEVLKKLSIITWLLLLCQMIVGAAPLQEKRIEFTLPQAPWTLTMPADDFQMAQKQMKQGGVGAYFLLIDETQGVNLSMYIEPVKDCQDSRSCRDMVWKLGNPAWVNPQNVVRSELGDVSFVEFLIPSFQGRPVRQQNMYAEFVVDGFWVDLHLSKADYKAEDHRLFERIIKSIKFEQKTKS
ncbi:MAG: hypothetical protein QOE96_2062 [Blastocatellia bacterium]|nr:hypothetical protein [Blastocatellia bacterium]